ncbi:hypothetical protein CYMTET_5018 [Cymbomonas tetramitiformis]|uniref:Uncharacterized protein n=1 Tax=Cymbomonas tetramitiformis TaxID=36881 RepID=A0AAE0LJV9_9CHLO|nr:hypothetical protein CYMTET_5018 [Cymbomonas tetramitiformis]
MQDLREVGQPGGEVINRDLHPGHVLWPHRHFHRQGGIVDVPLSELRHPASLLVVLLMVLLLLFLLLVLVLVLVLLLQVLLLVQVQVQVLVLVMVLLLWRSQLHSLLMALVLVLLLLGSPLMVKMPVPAVASLPARLLASSVV